MVGLLEILGRWGEVHEAQDGNLGMDMLFRVILCAGLPHSDKLGAVFRNKTISLTLTMIDPLHDKSEYR